MKQPKEVILSALHQYRGDNLERVQNAFRNFSSEKLNEQYGSSGKTCQEILDEYQEKRDKVDNAIMWANTL